MNIPNNHPQDDWLLSAEGIPYGALERPGEVR